MYLIRATNGRVLARSGNELEPVRGEGQSPAPTITSTIDGEEAMPAEELPLTQAEFEEQARLDAGLSEGEEVGEIYVEDESVSVASDKPGRRVGGKRLRAYPPDHKTLAGKLREKKGKKGDQSVTWDELEEVLKEYG